MTTQTLCDAVDTAREQQRRMEELAALHGRIYDPLLRRWMPWPPTGNRKTLTSHHETSALSGKPSAQ